jgi:hypothetical protein
MKRRSFLQLLGLAPMVASAVPAEAEALPTIAGVDMGGGDDVTMVINMLRISAQDYEALEKPDPETWYFITH